MSLSVPFFTPSVQVAAAQSPFVQMKLAQSAPERQAAPAAHALQVPPQSMSVSLPFFTLSLHAGNWQTLEVQT
jgi:hypothetical protein